MPRRCASTPPPIPTPVSNAEFSLVGTAEQNRTLVELTSESSGLVRAIQALRPRNFSGGGHLIEAVLAERAR